MCCAASTAMCTSCMLATTIQRWVHHISRSSATGGERKPTTSDILHLREEQQGGRLIAGHVPSAHKGRKKQKRYEEDSDYQAEGDSSNLASKPLLTRSRCSSQPNPDSLRTPSTSGRARRGRGTQMPLPTTLTPEPSFEPSKGLFLALKTFYIRSGFDLRMFPLARSESTEPSGYNCRCYGPLPRSAFLIAGSITGPCPYKVTIQGNDVQCLSDMHNPACVPPEDVYAVRRINQCRQALVRIDEATRTVCPC